MFESLTLRNRAFTPALFCAPMAGVTHSAFRRLVAEFGGYGALFTEMLSAKAVLRETFENSPYVRRRPLEGPVFYQILLGDTVKLDAIMERIRSYEPAGVDVNLACSEWAVRAQGSGSALFEDMGRMQRVLAAVRAGFDGPLTVKIRLGNEDADWQAEFSKRVGVIRECGVDAVVLHPRFIGQKLRRHARHDLLAWASGEIGLPLIVSGDVTGPEIVETRNEAFSSAAGLMIGRMVATRPWFFAVWQGKKPAIDHGALWMRFVDYVVEDFRPELRLSRVKMFTEYFSRNFVFGHTLFTRVQSSHSVEEARQRAADFFASNPAIDDRPHVLGIS